MKISTSSGMEFELISTTNQDLLDVDRILNSL